MGTNASQYYTCGALMRKKEVSRLLKDEATEESGDRLRKVLTKWDAISYGVGSTLGAGIFVLTGEASKAAGPAVVLSFVISAVCSLISALAYAEFAARVPLSGSAYSFTYVSLGEFMAWFIGWNLTLEIGIGAAAVARAWSSNLALFCSQLGAPIPNALWSYQVGPFNLSLLSFLICVLCLLILLAGARESTLVNLIITVVNVTLILFICIYGSVYVRTANWTEPLPVGVPVPTGCVGTGGWFPCGANGLFNGAAKVFFAYVGFDGVATLAEEVMEPQTDIPIGIIGTLSIVTVLYVGASLVVTGMVNWASIDPKTPLASAFTTVGQPWATDFIAIVTVTALTANVLTSLFGQARIFFRMGRDGLIFEAFGRLHPTTKVPLTGTIVTGLFAGLIAFFLDIDVLAEMISIGTLLAFSTVCAGVVLLRVDRAHPTRGNWVYYLLAAHIVLSIGLSVSLRFLESGLAVWVPIVVLVLWLMPVLLMGVLPPLPPPKNFTCPFVPYLPLLGIFFNLYLISSLNVYSFVRIIVWSILGFGIYFAYGIRYSKLIVDAPSSPTATSGLVPGAGGAGGSASGGGASDGDGLLAGSGGIRSDAPNGGGGSADLTAGIGAALASGDDMKQRRRDSKSDGDLSSIAVAPPVPAPSAAAKLD